MINMSRLPCAVGSLAQRAGCSGHMRCRHVHAASPALHQQQHRLGRSSALPTAYVSHELMFWHEPGPWGNLAEYVQPTRYAEHSETKRRLHNLVAVSGLLDSGALTQLRPEPATRQQLTRAHTPKYVDTVAALSADESKAVHRIGDESAFMPGGYDIAALAAGAALCATDAVLLGRMANAYALTRPPGHHATRESGGGYCIFNNAAVAALHALDQHQLERVAIVDWDVHHGNGTQAIFDADPRVLVISLHQAGNYPLHSGGVQEIGTGAGVGATLNVPLPPGSGSGAYRAAFERVVVPALCAFKPQLILVSSGYDASYMDPLGHMMLGSEDFRHMTNMTLKAADTPDCQGRVVALHEGGYSELYVPFCGLAVIEALARTRSKIVDPYWQDVSSYGYQELQPWQEDAVRAAAALLPGVSAAASAATQAT